MRTSRSVVAVGAASAIAGFTVVEMLLVVAIIALMTLGVAQVFRVTGDTVKIGKRLSNLTATGAMVERQIRSDFAALSREGFMVMKHRTAGGTPPYSEMLIPLAPGGPMRARRVDELVFFITGDFTSKRDPIYPTRQAMSTQARVYYGHGHRKNPTSATYYDPPMLGDLNNTADTPKFGMPGPNRYASDWILLRHLTLLCQPSTIIKERLPTNLDEPNPVYTGNGDPNMAAVEDLDSNVQIDLQPACPSIFRYINAFEPWNSDSRFSNATLVRDETPQRPQFASGIVDIATTDLTEIRSILLDAQELVARGTGNMFSLADDNFGNDPAHPERGSYFEADIPPRLVTNPNSSTRRMQLWMRSAMPSNTDAGERMRCEPKPPDFLGVIGSPGGTGFTKEYQRTDQSMLSASNFVMGCSEFIVEWSFGKAYPANDNRGRAGQLIWHGLTRSDGVTPTGAPSYAATRYGDAVLAGEDWYRMPYRRLDGTTGVWPLYEDTTTPFNNINVVREFNAFNPPAQNVYSYFAYIDPTYRLRSVWTDRGTRNGRAENQTQHGVNEIFEDLNGDGTLDAGDDPDHPYEETAGNGDLWFQPPALNDTDNTEKADPREPSTMPWPWPKLVRITMNIVDPTDPLREQTFQFILEVPEAANNARN